MLYGVMVVYDDIPHIVDTVNSIYGKVDHIIAVDGRYKDFPGERPLSTDGTTEYLESLSAVSVMYEPDLTEVEKRNKYLVGEVGDWYLHLDADEEWQGEICIPNADMQVHWLEVRASVHKRYPAMKRIRLFRHVEGLHYEGKHYWLRDGEGDTFSLLDKPGSKYKAEFDDEIKIMHNEWERTPERRGMKARYYRVLYKTENRIREVV
jgi:hypothetical protein